MNTKINSQLYWTLLTYQDWNLYMAATDHGLTYIGSQNKPFSEMEGWLNTRFPGSSLTQDDAWLQPYVGELSEYLEGVRSNFTLPADFRGTPFQLMVWKALGEIPYGETWSYSDIALLIEKPASVRAVGMAIGANPLLITVPCHRVIGKNGNLTGYRGGLDMKSRLLNLEQGTAYIRPNIVV